MFTLTSLRSPFDSSTIRSRTGATAWHGPHHSAQKSTITGLSLWRTSCSKLCVVTTVDIRFLSVLPNFRDQQLVTSVSAEPFPGLTPNPLKARSRIDTMARRFAPLPPVPDHPAIEQEVLARWDDERTFERLRELNRGNERFSFVDGPITANNPMGVHHAWGRTLKDVFQRYRALCGRDQRYQNGFDCQGLWVAVE